MEPVIDKMIEALDKIMCWAEDVTNTIVEIENRLDTLEKKVLPQPLCD